MQRDGVSPPAGHSTTSRHLHHVKPVAPGSATLSEELDQGWQPLPYKPLGSFPASWIRAQSSVLQLQVSAASYLACSPFCLSGGPSPYSGYPAQGLEGLSSTPQMHSLYKSPECVQAYPKHALSLRVIVHALCR